MENKKYPKVAIKSRGQRSSSLTLLIEASRATHTIPAFESLSRAITGANKATELILNMGSWKPEERVPPRPSQAVPKQSGFEMEAAREIVERHVESESDSELEEARSMPERKAGDEVDGGWSDGLI